MSQSEEAHLKRLRMRSWRRGMKEIDIVFGPWADAHLAQLSPETLALYDSLLLENDQDILSWILGRSAPPERFLQILSQISDFSQRKIL